MLALFLSLALPSFLASKQHGELETTETQLLQHHKFTAKGLEDQREKAEPLVWIHFPKTGSSFINIITHLPGICPGVAALNEDTVGGGAIWLSRWLEDDCPRVCDENKYWCPQPSHVHLPVTNYSAQKGHLVGMFRNPDQRILSGYHDDANNFAAFTEDIFDLHLRGALGEDLKDMPKRPLSEFAETWKGGMTYQLVTEHPTTLTLDPRRPGVTLRDAAEAARRVREGFAFVGLTEEWDLSVCLFHKMFGGACHAFEFENTRPSYEGKSADQDYNTSELQGWHDDIDEAIYAAASEVFHQNLILFKASPGTCQECYSHRERDSALDQERREAVQ